MSENELLNSFIQETVQFIMDYDVDTLSLQEFLLDFIETNFFVELDDQSESKIASLIMKLLEDL